MHMLPSSLHPPSHGDNVDGSDADVAGLPRPPTSWFLLDFRAYFADRRNSTTVACKTRDGNDDIQVTLFPARPPRVSHVCVYCPSVKASRFALEPRIIATDTRFLLLRVAICTPEELFSPTAYEYYIYKASGDTDDEGPYLELLPTNPYFLYDNQIGLLSRGNEYTVVALRDDASASHRGSSVSVPGMYDVCLFKSEEKTWTISAVLVPSDEKKCSNVGGDDEGFQHRTTKVITIGGEAGTLAFVDLWRGILLFDALSCNPSLRYFMLPPDSMTRRWGYESPGYTRDIVVVNGHFRFVEFLSKTKVSDHGYRNDGWIAYMWSKEVTSSQKDYSWCLGPKLESHNISFDHNPLLLKSLPKLPGDEGNKPEIIFERLHTTHPILGLDSDEILCLITKVELDDSKSWVIAIDMRDGRLQEVAEIDAERTVSIMLTYTQSKIF